MRLMWRNGFLAILTGFWVTGCDAAEPPVKRAAVPEAPTSAAAATVLKPTSNRTNLVTKTEAEWRALLTGEQFRVLRESGTERAFTGAYWNTKDKGTYVCAGCGEPLFSSDHKFDSGCGWPSYFKPLSGGVVTESEDLSHSMRRTEIRCARCNGHLGHVFNDGPPPTGLRYCINSASLKFEPAANTARPAAPLKAATEPAPGK